MASRCFLAAAVGLLSAATSVVAEQALFPDELVDDACAAGQDSEDCAALSLFQLRSKETTQDMARDVLEVPVGIDSPSFCAGIFTDWKDKCGSVRLKAPVGGFCDTKSTCGSCGGYWCSSQCTQWETKPSSTAMVALVEEKVSTVQGNASGSVDATLEADHGGKFCCLSATDPSDVCGSCLPNSQAPLGGGDYCATLITCGTCKGSWCKPTCTNYAYAIDPSAAPPAHVEHPFDGEMFAKLKTV